MDISTFIKKYTWSYAEGVTTICNPLFKHFGLNLFLYTRYYRDNTRVILANEPKWADHCISYRNYPVSAPVLSPGVHICSNFISKGMLKDAIGIFDFDHAISFVEEFDDFTELWTIGAPSSNTKVMELYFNNLDLIKLFLQYFREQANDIIKKAERNRAYTPNMILGEPSALAINREQFLKEINYGRGRTNKNSRQISITSREEDCLKYIAKGYTLKEAAKYLQLSPRTVETHINSLKTKLNCRRTKELILLSSNILIEK